MLALDPALNERGHRRRRHGRERLRPAAPPLRRHARPRRRRDRRALGRHAGALGRQGDQERRGLRPRQAVHGLARHARADRARRRAAAPAARRARPAPWARATTPSGSAPPRSRSPASRSRPTASTSTGATAPAGCSSASAAARPATRPPPPSRGWRRSGWRSCAVVEDDDELWMTQRVHQRGACVLKVSGVATDLPAVCRAGGTVVGRPALGLFWLSLPPQAEAVAAAREALAPRACTLLDAPAGAARRRLGAARGRRARR